MKGEQAEPLRRDFVLAKALTSFFIAYLFLRGFAGMEDDSRSLTVLRSWYYVGPFIGFLLMSAYFGAAVVIPGFRTKAIKFAGKASPVLGWATLGGFTLGWITAISELEALGVLSSVYFWAGLVWFVALYIDTLAAMWPFAARAESDWQL